jgi:hypothetical protein
MKWMTDKWQLLEHYTSEPMQRVLNVFLNRNCSLGCLTNNIKFNFHGSSAQLRNFKLLLSCRKKNQPDRKRFQASKGSSKISSQARIHGGSWRRIHEKCNCNTHDCDFNTQSVIYTRKVRFPYAECDFYTHTVNANSSVILTRTNVITTLMTVI